MFLADHANTDAVSTLLVSTLTDVVARGIECVGVSDQNLFSKDCTYWLDDFNGEK